MMKRHGSQKIPTTVFFSFSESNSGAVSHRIYTDTQTYIHTPFDGLSGIWTVNGVIGFYNLVDITCTMRLFAPLQYCIFFFKLMNLLVAPNFLKKLTNYRHHIQTMVKFGHFIGNKCSSSKKGNWTENDLFKDLRSIQFIHSSFRPSIRPSISSSFVTENLYWNCCSNWNGIYFRECIIALI